MYVRLNILIESDNANHEQVAKVTKQCLNLPLTSLTITKMIMMYLNEK